MRQAGNGVSETRRWSHCAHEGGYMDSSVVQPSMQGPGAVLKTLLSEQLSGSSYPSVCTDGLKDTGVGMHLRVCSWTCLLLGSQLLTG